MSLLIVGSIAFDSIETIKGKREKIIGGSANYASLAASLFTYSKIIGVVGEDYPKDIIEIMNQKGIDTTGLIVEAGDTFSWGGVYSDDFSQRTTLFTNLNVFETFNPVLNDSHKKSNYVLLGNIHPSLQSSVLDQLESASFVACDTMNLWINTTLDELKNLISKVDIILINEEEAVLLAGNNNLSGAAQTILGMGPSFLIIKKGSDGAVLYGKDLKFSIPAFPVEEVFDPTGAGDSFAGGLMAYLAMAGSNDKETFKRAMAAGTILASFCVEEFGVERLLKVTPEEVNDRFSILSELANMDATPLLK
ncbi:MAG: sugar kinase [Candidatus Marinimicrobia bacterium]|nr:sugar kinase [Candidatus Neomarinimicrobiota bacterium]